MIQKHCFNLNYKKITLIQQNIKWKIFSGVSDGVMKIMGQRFNKKRYRWLIVDRCFCACAVDSWFNKLLNFFILFD